MFVPLVKRVEEGREKRIFKNEGLLEEDNCRLKARKYKFSVSNRKLHSLRNFLFPGLSDLVFFNVEFIPNSIGEECGS